jgi:hypothetical protein
MAERQLQGRRPRPAVQTARGIEAAKMPGHHKKKRLHRLRMQVVLLRVGIDSGCGGIQGPLFEDGSFDFVCIPDNKGVSVHTSDDRRDSTRLVRTEQDDAAHSSNYP